MTKTNIRRKPIAGYDGAYEISEDGNVYSYKRPTTIREVTAEGKTIQTIVPSQMTLTENTSHDPEQPGQLSVNLRTPDGKTVKEYVSRLVYEAFGELPEDYFSEYRIKGRKTPR